MKKRIWILGLILAVAAFSAFWIVRENDRYFLKNLHKAGINQVVMSGQPDAVKQLLRSGVNIDQRDSEDNTPLAFIIGVADDKNPRHLEIAKVLLEHGADPKVKYRGTPLIDVAISRDMKKFASLLQKYEDNEKKKPETTAIVTPSDNSSHSKE